MRFTYDSIRDIGPRGNFVVRSLGGVAILLTATSIVSADGVDTVTVWFDDGRVLTAELDQRSDEHRLWLRFSQPLITLASSARWQDVVQGSYHKKIYNADEFRTLALSLRDKAPSRSGVEELPAAEEPADLSQAVVGRPPKDRYVTQPLGPPRVRSLVIDAELANWDADVEMDGLLLHVYPLTEHRISVPVDGSLRIEVLGQRVLRQRQATKFFELARTSHRVRQQDFGPAHFATYRIPFRTVHPEFQPGVGTYGLVHARLGIPGQGSFEASVHTRLRTFDPVRDQLQLERGKRFFASERTRGAGP